MLNNKKILAIIPARGGSKRLKNKNILKLAGKPLINWTIEAAINSQYIDNVLVTTDSENISKIAIKCGASVPSLRPKHLAKDTTSSFDVVEYCINNLNEKFDILILLQPTSPLRNNIDIDDALIFFEKKNAKAVVSVCETEHSPLWSNTLPNDFSMDKFIKKENVNIRSQDLPTYYRLNGAIYISNIKDLLFQKQFILKQKTYAYIMSQEKSVDIDNKLDFLIAEAVINQSQK